MRGVLALIALLLAALPAAATQNAWPALYDVTGVAANDVLNVRAGPSVSEPVIGTLAPDARGVEVIRPSHGEGWGLVNVGGRAGWASLAYLQRRQNQFMGAPVPLERCFGTEPFWSLAISDDRLRFSEPEGDREGPLERRVTSDLQRNLLALVGSIGGQPLHAIVRYEQCSDGMSDREFGFGVAMTLGDRLLAGCCSLSR